MFYRIATAFDAPSHRQYGQILSRHKDWSAAYTKLPRVMRDVQAVIEVDEMIEVGAIRADLADAYRAEEERGRRLQVMKSILTAEDEGEPLPDWCALLVADGFASLSEFRAQHEEEARELMAKERAATAAHAEQKARMRAVEQEFSADAAEMSYSFPAVQGVQAGKAYYVAQVPCRFLVRLFLADEEELPADLRAQRSLNPRRAAAITDYVLANPSEYVLPALTVSVSSAMRFEALEVAGVASRVGELRIPLDAQLLINDGQHRRAGLAGALKENPRLKDETIAVVFFYDEGLTRSQQIFADINASMVKPSAAITALYDQRNPLNVFARELLDQLPDFRALVDFEQSSVGAKSAKLWSLVAFKKFLLRMFAASERGFAEFDADAREAMQAFALQALTVCREQVPMWSQALARTVPASEMRDLYVTGHAVFLEALGILLGHFWHHYRRHGELAPLGEKLPGLAALAADKAAACWSGRCIRAGRMQKNADGVTSTAAQLVRAIGEAPTPEMLLVERRLGVEVAAAA